MRTLVFLASFAVSVGLFGLFSDASLAFTVYMSGCLAAVSCTVLTTSGRSAGRRMLRNLRTGWDLQGH